MCGHAGVFSLDRRVDQDAYVAAVTRMSELIARRGPDDDGLWTDGACRMAFRRLSILDLSQAGHQPMVSGDGRSVLVFNGELYNFAELRAELEGRGVRFRSRSDTEVVLESLVAWGADALRRFNGMFSFAWYVPAERQLILARDHAGIKPMYWSGSPDGQAVAFASQFDAVLCAPWLRRNDVDPHTLRLYLQLHHLPPPHTLNPQVFQLPPGHMLLVRPGLTPRPIAFWTLPRQPQPDPRLVGEAAVDAVEAALGRAVRRQRIADVPLGVFLSGGVDSAIVTALARQQTDASLTAYTIGNPGWAQDEAADASEFARHLDVRHRLHNVAGEDALGLLEDVAALQHEPFADFSILPTLMVCKAARETLKVSLSGDGGDELFFGYERPLSLMRNGGAFRFPLAARRAYWLAGRLVGKRRSDAILADSPGDFYRGVNCRFPVDQLAQVAPGLPGFPEDFVIYDSHGFDGPRGLADFSRHAEWHGQLQRGLKKVDMASMHVGLEVRVPMLDREVVELALTIPPEEQLAGGVRKSVLRRLLERHIPADKINRKKRGFAVPIGEWFRGALKPVLHAELVERDLWPHGVFDRRAVSDLVARHDRGEGGLKWQLWTLLALQLWARRLRA